MTWTTVSRVTGLGRVLVMAAVLGPTYLGNTFAAVNLVPTLTFELFTGAILPSLLVPPLVRSIQKGIPEDTERLAGSFLGLAIALFVAVTVVALALGPILLRFLTAGVDDPATAHAQRQAGLLLLVLVMPQCILYGLGGVGAAVLNAHGRFGLAAAAPALENIGLMVTMALVAVFFGTGSSVHTASGAQLGLLGAGSTIAVLLHTGTQWLWARHVAVRVVPRRGWREPAVAEVVRRAMPTIGTTGLNVGGVFLTLVLANRLAGGVVAFDTARYLVRFPVNVISRPMSVVSLTRLARFAADGKHVLFRDELARVVSLTSFFIVPAAVACVVLASPLASALAFGEMAQPEGLELLTIALALLGPSVLGEAAIVIGTHASYARDNAHDPFRATVTRTVALVLGAAVASTVAPGRVVLAVLGLSVSAGALLAGLQLGRQLQKSLPEAPDVAPPLLRALLASVVAVIPAGIAAVAIRGALGGRSGAVLAIAMASVIGVATYGLAHYVMRSPELRVLRRGASRLRSRPRS